jgi:hypothetical protein
VQSYPLLRPDGAESGVWACGACHRAHAQTRRNALPETEANRTRAEQCCVPRTCRICGRPTERDVLGDHAGVHLECLPAPAPPHATMTGPWARLLYRRMSDISEEGYAAGWRIGLEFALWRMLQGGDRRYGQTVVSADDLEELRLLSERAGGWIWTDRDGSDQPQLVPWEVWKIKSSE